MGDIITCANCQRSLQVPENFLGQKVQCPDCGHTFVATGSSANVQPKSASPPPLPPRDSDRPVRRRRLDDDDEEFVPRRSRRDRFGEDMDNDDDDDGYGSIRKVRRRYPPHRGGLIMALGLISLIGGWLFCLPVVVGPVAWILGQIDLRAIREGRMDPAGESMVRTGQVCGIISTIILLLSVVVIGCLILTGLK